MLTTKVSIAKWNGQVTGVGARCAARRQSVLAETRPRHEPLNANHVNGRFDLVYRPLAEADESPVIEAGGALNDAPPWVASLIEQVAVRHLPPLRLGRLQLKHPELRSRTDPASRAGSASRPRCGSDRGRAPALSARATSRAAYFTSGTMRRDGMRLAVFQWPAGLYQAGSRTIQLGLNPASLSVSMLLTTCCFWRSTTVTDPSLMPGRFNRAFCTKA